MCDSLVEIQPAPPCTDKLCLCSGEPDALSPPGQLPLTHKPAPDCPILSLINIWLYILSPSPECSSRAPAPARSRAPCALDWSRDCLSRSRPLWKPSALSPWITRSAFGSI